MNNKEFQTGLANALGVSRTQAASYLHDFVETLTEGIAVADEVALAQLGSFEVKEKKQRMMINPKTKEQILIPPKLSLSFKPSGPFKNKYK